MIERFLCERVTLHIGDCRDVLAVLPENSFESCVTDPPYHLTSIVKRFGSPNAKPVRVGDINATSDLKAAHARAAAGFMGKVWDGGDIAFDAATWAVVLRVLKPGAHAAVFCIPKHVGFVQVAMQEAGFEFRDVVVYAFGSGFPKSHDVSKGIDRMLGAEREVIGSRMRVDGKLPGHSALGANQTYGSSADLSTLQETAPATDAARQWEGWGTALKPAVELIILARKPLSEGTVAANVLKWGTGAINVDGCRVPGQEYTQEQWSRMGSSGKAGANGFAGQFSQGMKDAYARGDIPVPSGRWPANLMHDGSAEVVAAFPDDNPSGGKSGFNINQWTEGGCQGIAIPTPSPREPDSGSAARFFYTAKADADDRLGSKHPTVKPLDLMQYLVRLITPPRGTVIDPFAGTGTTGEAAWREGMNTVLIEREAEYAADIRRRMALALAGPDERVRESIKAKNLPRDDGPLFDWEAAQ